MYEHSIKVPRLYKAAAKIAQKVKEDGASLKQLIYEKKHPNIKAIYALVLSTLNNEENLNAIIRKTQILTNENRLDPWLARVLMTELLWGKKSLPGNSKPVQTVLSYQEKFLKNCNVENENKKEQKVKPKYVRVNTLIISVSEVVEIFRYEGWTLVRCGDGSDYAAFLATTTALAEDQFMIDLLIKDLLVFPPKTEFYQHKLYKDGSIVLQDKASCIAPWLLNPPEGSTVLDMCSAPGMKCIQLASMVGESGKIYAIERDQRRYDILKKLLTSTQATNATAINKDVLTLTEKDLKDVEYILVDPSCSGSGMIDRVNFDKESHFCESRLQKLAGFQITILRHALNNFKSVKRIVYSTCSIFPQENEEVVKQAITTIPDFKLVDLKQKLKRKWYNFGSEDYGKIGTSCLYAKPDFDHTNGFFIAVFERLEDDERNEFFVKRVQRTSECENLDSELKNTDNNTSNRKRKNSKNEDNYEEVTTSNKQLDNQEKPSKKKKKAKIQ